MADLIPPNFDDRLPLLDPDDPGGLLLRPPVGDPGGKELASLVVNGVVFTNWTSVRVEARYLEAYPLFQFECTEATDVPLNVTADQFKPGTVVRVLLGGVSAVFGYVTERHVGYDANQHGVRLVGKGDTHDLETMVPPDKLSGHDNKSWSALAQDLMQHLGTQLRLRGAVDNTPFENVQINPGDTILKVLEMYARHRNIHIGSHHNGGLTGIGPHAPVHRGTIQEAVHVLRANVAIRDDNIFKFNFAMGSGPGGNGASGDSTNKIIAMRPGTHGRSRYNVVPLELGGTQHDANQRANMEQSFTQGTEIVAQITVQGWFKDNNKSDELWRPGEYYTLQCPMLMLNNELLGCRSCVYEQNDSGTTTTLEMVNEIGMNGKGPRMDPNTRAPTAEPLPFTTPNPNPLAP